MTDDHVSEVEGSSIPPEPVSPQLSASSSNDKPKLQPMDELLESSPPTSTSPTQIIPVTVGPERKVFEVSEYLLKKIPCFTSIFQKRGFHEGAEGQLKLPKDDPLVFDRVLQFLRTGDYLPHIVPSLEPCDKEYINSLFQYKQQLEFRNLHECERRYDASCCGSLEWTLEVMVNLKENIEAPYHHGDPQFGRWKTADATHTLFEREVLLFCMAERFMMDDLKELCLSKIRMFPLCIQYHQRYFDEWRSGGWFWNLSENACDYADYLKVIESQMTGHGAMLFHAIAGARHTIERSVGSTHGSWECSYERIAVSLVDYTDRSARNDLGLRASWGVEETEAPAPEIQNLDKFYPGFEFCEAHAGDTIMHIILNKPKKGFVYGLNIRADRWSWYPRDILRFLETKSYRDCTCYHCQPPSFKANGRGPRLYHHDLENKGLDYRPGTRQADIEKERKAREA